MIRLGISGESPYLRRYALLVRALGKRGYDVSQIDDGRSSAATWLRYAVAMSRFGAGAAVAAAMTRERTDIETIKSRFYRSADAFVAKSHGFQQRIEGEPDAPDAVLHVFGFSSPFATVSPIPFAHYLDDTCALRSRSAGNAPAEGRPHDVERFTLVERKSYERAARLFVASQFVATSLSNDYGIPATKIEVVGTGPTMEIADEIPKLFGTRRLLFNASEFERRGGDLVMAAFACLHRDDPSITLVTIGAALPLAYAGRAGVDDRGLVTTDVLRELYTTSDLLLSPASSGPLPHVAMEAMAHGTPIVARNRDGVTDLLTHERDGIVLSDDDARPERLAEIVSSLLGDDARLRALSAAARATVAERLNWNVVAEKMAPFFESVAHRTPAPPRDA